MFQCIGLSAKPTAYEVGRDIEFSNSSCDLKWLMDNDPQCLSTKIVVARAAIDFDLPLTRLEPYPRNRGLSLSDGGITTWGFCCCHFLDLDLFWLLCLMRMLGSSIDTELFHQMLVGFIFWEHPMDGTLDQSPRISGEEFLCSELFNPPLVPAMVVVFLLFPFISGEPHLGGVDRDHKIARILMRCVNCLGFSTQDIGDLRRRSTKDLVLQVDDNPIPCNRGLIC